MTGRGIPSSNPKQRTFWRSTKIASPGFDHPRHPNPRGRLALIDVKYFPDRVPPNLAIMIVSLRKSVTCSHKYVPCASKGSVQIEAFNSRFKSENRSLSWEQEDLASLTKVVGKRIQYYNHVRRHSALGNQSPIRYLKEEGIIPR